MHVSRSGNGIYPLSKSSFKKHSALFGPTKIVIIPPRGSLLDILVCKILLFTRDKEETLVNLQLKIDNC